MVAIFLGHLGLPTWPTAVTFAPFCHLFPGATGCSKGPLVSFQITKKQKQSIVAPSQLHVVPESHIPLAP